MVPNVGQFDAEKGGGFGETVGYVLAPESAKTREAVAAGLIDPALLQHRAAFAVGFNLDGIDHRDPAAVAAAMQDIADRANELKKAAGIDTRGRKATTSPVWHCSFRDAEHTAALLTDQEMIDGIHAALKALDLPEGHQILIVKHVEPDRPHWPDWHVIVNKVNSRDGTRWNPMNDQIKLQAFCHDWDKSRGLTLCPDRAEKIERVREWAAAEPDPKKRDRTPPVKEPKPAKPNYTAEKVLAQMEREGLPMTAAVAAAIDKQLEDDRAAWRKIGRYAKKEIRDQAKRETSESWAKLKADRAAIDAKYNGPWGKTLAWAQEFARKGLWANYNRRADAQRTALEQQIKGRYRRFYHNEKTAAGAAMNAAALILEANRRGNVDKAGITITAMLTNPDMRKKALEIFAHADRQALKEKLKADRAAVQKKAAKFASPARAEKASAWAEHQQRIMQIKAVTAVSYEELKAAREAEPKKQRKAWNEIAELARQEKQKLEQRARESIGGLKSTSDLLRPANPFDGVFGGEKKQDVGRGREPPRGGMGR